MRVRTLFAGLVGMVAAAAAACAISVSAGAETSGYWEYTIDHGGRSQTATVTGYTGNADTLTIPSAIDGYTVKAIDEYAFNGADKFKSVIIPDTVDTIGDYAFASTSIQSVTVPNSVTDMGERVFANCKNLTKVYFGYGDTHSDMFINSPNVCLYCYPDSPIVDYTEKNNIKYALQKSVGAASIKLDKTSVVLECNTYTREYALINATVLPANSTDGITWTSTDENIVSCVKGSNLIHAEKAGTATVKATTTSGKTAVCTVTVVSHKPTVVGALKLTGRSSSSLTVSWSAAQYADGYIIEKQINGSWTRIKKITDPKTTSYKLTGLKPSTAYPVRVRSYQMAGSVAVYSDYKIGAWATAPSNVSGFKLKARSSSTLRLTWSNNTSADGYILEQKSGDTWKQIADFAKNTTVECRITGLKAGTAYSFRIKSYKTSGSSTLYSGYVSLSARTNPTGISGFKLKARSSSVLRIMWNKNTSADGYILEQKSGGEWKRIAKFTKNTTAECRITGLKAGTAYSFRVKAYKMSGKTALYSGYTTLSARTAPTAVSGLKLKASAKDAIRLAWDKNTSADGYIIEMKSGDSWTRVGKITKNSTVEFRKDSLKSKTSYTFRVKTYKMSGKTALYGATKTITVKTK